MILITPSQCRAARALLNWSQPDLAARCGMHVQTISAFESETGTPTKRTLERIVKTFESASIELLPSDGVRRIFQPVTTYSGLAGFEDFMEDVFETIRKSGGEICVSNVNEKDFDACVPSGFFPNHVERMIDLQKEIKFMFKILAREGDHYFPARAYASYRWIESRYFHTVPFYVYGSKLAIIYFKQGPIIHVVDNIDIADAQRIQFNVLWDGSKIPPEFIQ